jgi:hypothetical protein
MICNTVAAYFIVAYGGAQYNGGGLQERRIMLSFKGAVYTMYDTHPSTPRQTLMQFHNGKDIIVALTCWADSVSCEPCVPPDCLTPKKIRAQTSTHSQCSTWTADAAKYDFDELLLDSKFTVVLPGEGTHSYRLYEALQAGSIPIVLGESLLPLEHLIDWTRIAVIQRDASPRGIQALIDALRGATPMQLADMQANGRRVFNANLKDIKQQLHSGLADISRMMAKEVNKSITAEQEANKTAAAALSHPNMIPPSSKSAPVATDSTTAKAASAPTSAEQKKSSFGEATTASKTSTSSITPIQGGAPASTGADQAADAELVAALNHYKAGEAVVTELLLPDATVLRPLSRNDGAPAQVALTVAKQVSSAVSEMLLAIQHALASPHIGKKALISNASYYLSFLYSVAGMWRMATTAASASVVLSTAISPHVLLRVRNSFCDMRRPVNTPAMQHSSLLWRVYRPDEGAFEFDEPTLSGYDAVSHFLSPVPFASIDSGRAAILPLALPPAPAIRHTKAIMSTALVSEHVLQHIAAKLQHKLLVEFVNPGFSSPVSSGTKPKIAIVSMCAYDNDKTVLTRLSTANLERYCSLHRGRYACILHSSVVDSSRTPAWSKVSTALLASGSP